MRKPRWWALALAEQLGDDLCAVTLDGDGAGSLVDAWASRAADGRIDVLIWNGTLQQNFDHADRRLDRQVRIRVEGLDADRYRMRLARVDETHSNIRAHDDGEDWPTTGRWAALTTADRLYEDDQGLRTPVDRAVTVDVDLPMPGVARLRLDPR